MDNSTTDGIEIQQCGGCGLRLFPDRLLCPTCHGSDFSRIRVGRGRVKQVSVRPGDGTAVATVESHGVWMIARVPLSARPGDEVDLSSDERDATTAYVPQPNRSVSDA